MDPTKSRGFRNKNPGNIDYNERNKWQGQVGKEPGPNGRFAVFESHEFGIRALAVLLTTYQDRHGLRTIRKIISRWAPGNENDTDSYVAQVAQNTGLRADEELDLHKHEHLRPLVLAIIKHELGGQPYDNRTIDEGLRLAGVARPVHTIAEAASTGTGRGAIQVGAATAVAAAAAPVVEALGGLNRDIGVALVFAAAVVAIVLVLKWRRT